MLSQLPVGFPLYRLDIATWWFPPDNSMCPSLCPVMCQSLHGIAWFRSV
jgi:hypothetical protein